jgi:hypothetical protein
MSRIGPMTLAFGLHMAVVAQDVPKPVELKGAFDLFTTDELGHVYALKGDELFLSDANGKPLAKNSLKTFGEITCLDATFSLKPMIFSRQQRQLAVLDNTLSLQGAVIDLSRSGWPQVALACASVQNAFWLFDERDLQLIRVDAQLRPLATTGRLDQVLGFAPHPTEMHELDGWLYVNDPERGVHVFDLFAAFTRTLPIIGAHGLEVRAGSIFHMKDGAFVRYDLLSRETMPIAWPSWAHALHPTNARLENTQLYLLTEDGVTIGALEDLKR